MCDFFPNIVFRKTKLQMAVVADTFFLNIRLIWTVTQFLLTKTHLIRMICHQLWKKTSTSDYSFSYSVLQQYRLLDVYERSYPAGTQSVITDASIHTQHVFKQHKCGGYHIVALTISEGQVCIWVRVSPQQVNFENWGPMYRTGNEAIVEWRSTIYFRIKAM